MTISVAHWKESSFLSGLCFAHSAAGLEKNLPWPPVPSKFLQYWGCHSPCYHILWVTASPLLGLVSMGVHLTCSLSYSEEYDQHTTAVHATSPGKLTEVHPFPYSTTLPPHHKLWTPSIMPTISLTSWQMQRSRGNLGLTRNVTIPPLSTLKFALWGNGIIYQIKAVQDANKSILFVWLNYFCLKTNFRQQNFSKVKCVISCSFLTFPSGKTFQTSTSVACEIFLLYKQW